MPLARAAATLMATSLTVAAHAQQAEIVRLDNGLTLVLAPMADAPAVAIEAIYRVGFLDEPEGMAQVSHLVEHLACRAATEQYPRDATWQMLNEIGMVNAETLPTWTHYDYMALSDQLSFMLGVEADRLNGLRIDEAIVREEATHCEDEAKAVAASPSSPVMKFALMAANQAWRYGAGRVSVAGGLGDLDPAAVKSFHDTRYAPDVLTLVVVGGFDRDEAVRIVREAFGDDDVPGKPRTPIDWNGLDDQYTIEWDLPTEAAVIAFPPPESEAERAALTLWGALLGQQMMQDTDLNGVSPLRLSSGPGMPVGDLPFFVYATAHEDASAQDVAGVLRRSLRTIVAQGLLPSDAMQLQMYAQQVTAGAAPTWEQISGQAAQLAQMSEFDAATSLRYVLGNTAIQLGVGRLLTSSGDAPEGLDAALAHEALDALIKRTIDDEKAIVTLLGPAADAQAPPAE